MMKDDALSTAMKKHPLATAFCSLLLIVASLAFIRFTMLDSEDGGASRAAENPQHQAAARWLASNSFGEIDWMSPAPDWQKGTRTNVVTKNGKELLFYFAGDKLCGVWAVEPREQLFTDENC